MPPEMGRPKIPNPKNIDLKVRIDKETETKLEVYCKEHEITKAEAIRQGIHLLMTNKK